MTNQEAIEIVEDFIDSLEASNIPIYANEKEALNKLIQIAKGVKPVKFVLEEPKEPISIKTPQELEETLHEVINNVSPINAKIDLDLVKNTNIGAISI